MKDRQAPIGPIASVSPTSPELVGGKMMLPADLQRLHRFMLDTDVIEVISDEMREVVEAMWPELIDKLTVAYVSAARDNRGSKNWGHLWQLNKADEYRAKARECDERAAHTVDPFIKQQMMEIAQKWPDHGRA